MLSRSRFSLAAVVCAGLLGCASGGAVTPPGQSAPEAFEKGTLQLSCGIPCETKARTYGQLLKKFHDEQKWGDLANMVASIGYDNDLSFYYLGRAAEGLGHDQAARAYYFRAWSAQKRCDSVTACSGIFMPTALAEADDRLNGDKTKAASAALPATAAAPIAAAAQSSPATPAPVPRSVAQAPAPTPAPIQVTPPAAPAVEPKPARAPVPAAPARARFGVEYDEFQKRTKYQEQRARSSETALLVASKPDRGAVSYGIAVYVSSSVSRSEVHTVYDSDGSKLEFERQTIDLDFKQCMMSSCKYAEVVAIFVSETYLEERVHSGVRFKLIGEKRDHVFTIEPARIEALLEVVREDS